MRVTAQWGRVCEDVQSEGHKSARFWRLFGFSMAGHLARYVDSGFGGCPNGGYVSAWGPYSAEAMDLNSIHNEHIVLV